MLVLTPGVFVQKKKEIHIAQDSTHQNVNHKITKVYPIELWIGGQIGNNGINPSIFHQGNYDGTMTLYFEAFET
jgi:hypothetical protein